MDFSLVWWVEVKPLWLFNPPALEEASLLGMMSTCREKARSSVREELRLTLFLN
jgi:hypothetical protein